MTETDPKEIFSKLRIDPSKAPLTVIDPKGMIAGLGFVFYAPQVVLG